MWCVDVEEPLTPEERARKIRTIEYEVSQMEAALARIVPAEQANVYRRLRSRIKNEKAHIERLKREST